MKKILNSVYRSFVFYAAVILGIAFLSSCTESNTKESIAVRSESMLASYPFEANGMKYLIVRPQMYEGVAIINLTKDSLEVASLRNN